MASVAVPTSTQAKAPEASVPPVMSLPRKLTGCAQWLTKTNVVLPSPSLRQSAAATLPLLLLLLLLPLPLPLPLPPPLLLPLPSLPVRCNRGFPQRTLRDRSRADAASIFG